MEAFTLEYLFYVSVKDMKEHEERNIQQQPKREEEQVMDQGMFNICTYIKILQKIFYCIVLYLH